MPTAFGTELADRRIDLRPKGFTSDGKLELLFDGEVVEESKPKNNRVEVTHDGITVTAKLAWHEQTIRWADASVDGADSVPMDPEPGSRRAKLEEWGTRHPKLYAARFVASGVGEVIVGIIGVSFVIGFLLNFLPAVSVPTPDINLPSINLPSLPLPDINLPDRPGWVDSILATTKYWVPIAIGLGLSLREYDRRKKNQEKREAKKGGNTGNTGEGG